ncbi:venom metalloproteinase antarease-like TtrivMP_A isoform X2 [Rhipicephalus sanguineus]|uniref:venom metalloproteinase antarease-like TtrivMP_A isoform X2 n=1 Tax=Rhipicephalus sanguineus TaxID=34632 RepID=UPI0020C378A9|nr:venom metalloproteinase antarease-like TtrivMP_A isoform X2 [Rhipicephalus sanguineus]
MCAVKKTEMVPAFLILQFLRTCYGEEFLVYPTLLQTRDAAANFVLHITDKIILNLERSSVLADELHFVTTSDDGDQLDMVDTSTIQESLYHDTHHQSSVRLLQRDGLVQVEGVINSKLRIKPLPERERSLRGQMLHKVYEVNENYNGLFRERTVLEPSQYDDRYESNYEDRVEARDMSPELFIVEIHVISDKVHQTSFRKNEDLIAYTAVMANAVNLRYLEMEHPKIKFKLVGVTRQSDSFGKVNGDMLDSSATLEELGKYYKKKHVPGNPDLVFMLSGLDLVDDANGRALTGIAYRGHVCKNYRVGMGEDIATSYSGVKTMAHEMAHILGSPHDQTPRCPWKDGYLMSYLDGGTRKYRLSVCSQEEIRSTVRKLPQRCFDEQSKTNYMAQHKKFPGQSVRPQYYCRKMLKVRGKGTKVVPEKIDYLSQQCKMKCCMKDSFGDKCYTVNILEGMGCTKGKTCRRGTCGNYKWPL